MVKKSQLGQIASAKGNIGIAIRMQRNNVGWYETYMGFLVS